MPSSTTKALCLLLVVIVAIVGAASAAKPIPGSCLMAASTLCANADTNALRCLRKLTIAGDARVPSACAEAIMADVNPARKQAPRITKLARLLTEHGTCNGANTCPSSQSAIPHLQCNDANAAHGCSGCSQGTLTISAGQDRAGTSVVNTCANICCKAADGNAACCLSSTSGIVCFAAGHSACSI